MQLNDAKSRKYRSDKTHYQVYLPLFTASIIAFTDDDALPHDGWLEAVIAPLERMEDVIGVGGPVVPIFEDVTAPAWYKRLVRRKATHFLGPKHDYGTVERDYVVPQGTALGPAPLGGTFSPLAKGRIIGAEVTLSF